MNDEWLHARERAGEEPKEIPRTVTGPPNQLLTGLPIGLPTQYTCCACCVEKLVAGQSAVVYGYRTAEDASWDIQRAYCTGCAPSVIRTPTLGVIEILAEGSLGTLSVPRDQVHRSCLVDVDLQAYSPPREGARL